MTTATATAIADTALAAAADAALSHPFYADDRADCGRAWVVIPAQKGRKALLDALRSECPTLHISKHHAGGMSVAILGGVQKQSRAIYEAGCDAFCATLARFGLEAHTYSYAD